MRPVRRDSHSRHSVDRSQPNSGSNGCAERVMLGARERCKGRLSVDVDIDANLEADPRQSGQGADVG